MNQAHTPRRGDDVATWLKKHRDEYTLHSGAWCALDDALDDYRLHADVGRPLFVEVKER